MRPLQTLRLHNPNWGTTNVCLLTAWQLSQSARYLGTASSQPHNPPKPWWTSIAIMTEFSPVVMVPLPLGLDIFVTWPAIRRDPGPSSGAATGNGRKAEWVCLDGPLNPWNARSLARA